LPAQREIFGFVRQQYTTLDPQEAVYYMLWLHEIALEDRQAPGKFVVVPENAQDRQHIDSVVARAGSQFFNDALGTWLLHGIKYYFHRCNEIAPYFEEADILKTALSYRENALAALPVAASHRPFKERAFFKGLETYISDPLKFFAFEHMIPFFEVTSKKALYVSMPYCDVESDGSNSILGLEDHEVTDFSELLRDDGKRIGMSTVKIVAAMQRTADDETNILNQYLAQAASLTDKLKTAEQIRMAVLEGLQAGVVEEAQRLLGDRSELALLRHKTIEGMRTCP